MSNTEKFNELLNSCSNPQAIMAVLLALAKDGFFSKKEARHEHQP